MSLLQQRIKLLIVGGCFPVQDNIEPNLLYHQLLKDKLNESNNIFLDISIIRYESIFKDFEKIKEAFDNKNPDWILFHLRVEPILLLSKLYFKYHSTDGNLIKQINVAAFNWNFRKKSSKKRIPNSTLNGESKIKLRIRFLFREANYFLGFVAGNWHHAFKAYLVLLTKTIELCKNYDKSLLITGPVSRPNIYHENKLSMILDKYMGEYSVHHDQIYINFLGTKDKHGNFLFCDDSIKVNVIGHKRIFEILFKVLIDRKLILPKEF